MRGASEFMSDEMGIEKIDLDKVDWRGSRDFFESLGEALDRLDDKDESYDFTWVGKRKSIIEAGAPINKTFRPDVENSKNWDTTENLFIEGDNLDALKLLQESYLGKVKMIYIDPPYNTGRDFVYHDNFKASIEEYDENTEYKDESGSIQFKKNEKSNGRYHSDWLSMMYPRLKLARNLLTDDGVMLISIDDNEQANLKKICDEIFGEDNIEAMVWNKEAEGSSGTLKQTQRFRVIHENILVAYRNKDATSFYKVREALVGKEHELQTANLAVNAANEKNDHANYYTITNPSGDEFTRQWKWNKTEIDRLIAEDLIYWGSDGRKQPRLVIPTDDRRKTYLLSILNYGGTTRGNKDFAELLPEVDFSYPKPVVLISKLIESVSADNSMILDFFSGSGTVAHAVMRLNAEDGGDRRWIMVQLPEETNESDEAYKNGFKTIPDIARERIRRAGDKIAAEYPEAKVDFGFRALRIDDTNYKEVYKPAGEQQQSTLLNLVDNIKDDRSELDLLYGVITQSALELNRPLETREIAGSNVFLYDYFGEVSGLVACFGDSISEETIKEIAKLKPLTAVFRDSTFPDSQAKVNLGEHFRILSAETKVKVI